MNLINILTCGWLCKPSALQMAKEDLATAERMALNEQKTVDYHTAMQKLYSDTAVRLREYIAVNTPVVEPKFPELVEAPTKPAAKRSAKPALVNT